MLSMNFRDYRNMKRCNTLINKVKTTIKFNRKTGVSSVVKQEILEEDVMTTDEFINKLTRLVFGKIKQVAEECIRECNK